MGSDVHASTLLLDMSYNVRNLGTLKGSTPFSYMGPACSGSLLALSHNRRYPAVESALLGAEAMHRYPFHISSAADSLRWDNSTYKERVADRPCRLCREPDTTEDISTRPPACRCLRAVCQAVASRLGCTQI